MISLIEYAALALHVYTPIKIWLNNFEVKDLPTSEIVNGNYHHSDDCFYRLIYADPMQHPNKPFYAQLYVKLEQGQAVGAVMAIRGTEFWMLDNIRADIITWYSDAMGGRQSSDAFIEKYLTQAMAAYASCLNYLATFFPNIHTVTLTGHSLGGAIAQLMVLKAGYGVPVVAFNSPGCGHLPGVIKNHAFWIKNINSRYGIINKLGLTTGHLFAVGVPNRENEAKELYRDFNKALYIKANQHIKKASGSEILPEKLLDYESGRFEQFTALAETIARFQSSAEVRAQYLRCMHPEDLKIWARIEDEEMAPFCAESIFLFEPEKVIMAQHDMKNLLTALHMADNLNVANRYV